VHANRRGPALLGMADRARQGSSPPVEIPGRGRRRVAPPGEGSVNELFGITRRPHCAGGVSGTGWHAAGKGEREGAGKYRARRCDWTNGPIQRVGVGRGVGTGTVNHYVRAVSGVVLTVDGEKGKGIGSNPTRNRSPVNGPGGRAPRPREKNRPRRIAENCSRDAGRASNRVFRGLTAEDRLLLVPHRRPRPAPAPARPRSLDYS